MPSDFSIHSDLLVHWTGKDIDETHQPKWQSEDQREMSTATVEAYIERLRNILTHGFWMTDQEIEFHVDPAKGRPPAVPCVCFTELKLSQSRSHAEKFGRLGIAVKRPFLFEKDGRPIVYFEPRFGRDVLLDAMLTHDVDLRFMHFWKPMDSRKKGKLKYDLYSESEWRIVEGTGPRCADAIVNPRESENQATIDYYGTLSKEAKHKLRYLVSLDGWLAAIVYPNFRIKNAAQDPSSGVPQLIREIAKRGHGYRVEGLNLPAEIDLDLCMHF